MIKKISNGILTVSADTVGAALTGIGKDGAEYIWQADPRYWDAHDLNLFPYVGRLTDEKYIFSGKEYHMEIHGFAKNRTFDFENLSDTSMSFLLADSTETLNDYPFRFLFSVTYSLDGNTLLKKSTVTNTGKNEMFFGIGSHPGFNVPINGEGNFDDWYLEFPRESSPLRIGFDQSNYRINDENKPFPLVNGRELHLAHKCFDLDAIVLSGVPDTVTLKSTCSRRSVKISYPDMDFLGIWHKPCSDAPYVCIEPWKSLPSHSAYIEDITKQEHIVHLPAGESYTNTISIEII